MYVETTGNTIHIFGRNPDGSRYSKTEKYNNYLYAYSPNGQYTTLFGETVTRQYYDEFNRKEMRNVIEAKKLTTYEADVPLKIRYYIDKFDALPEDPLRVCMLDIEVEDRDGFPDMNVFDKPILSICCHDNFKNKMHVFYVAPDGCGNKNTRSDAINHYVFKTEEAMLKTFVKFIKDMDFDLIFAWNGDRFDFPYIFGRMKICGIKPEKLSPMNKCDYVNGKPVGRYWIDLLEAYKKVSTSQLESFSLDYVGKATVGRGKVEHAGKVGEMWENDIDLFLEYNINDVQLMIDIEKTRGIIKYFDTIRRVAFCSFYDVFFNSRVLDCYFLKEAQRRGIILPNKPQFTDEYEKIQGARVILPVPGLHWYVAVGDVRSLYPTAILTGNMSPETIDENGDIVVGDTTFRSEPRGFVPQVIQSLWDLRQSWKTEMKKYPKGSSEYEMWDNLQTVAKFLLNSIYGVLLMPGSRLFDRRIGAAITYFGRETNMWMEKKLVEQGYAILGGDTDSMIFLVGKDDPDAARNAIEYINDTLNHFCEARFGSSKFNKMYIEFDKMYRTVLFVADESGEAVKKRYAGMIYVSDGKVLDEPYLDIKGFDSKRSDTPQFIRNEQKTIFKMILTGSGKDEVKTHIKKIRETVTSGELPPEDIAVPCGMSKMLHEYDNTSVPIHIHGARYYNNYCGGNIKKEKLKYLYVKRVPMNYPITHVVSFVETAPEGFVWDLERMAVRLVDDKFKNILYSLGWGDQTTLESFLG